MRTALPAWLAGLALLLFAGAGAGAGCREPRKVDAPPAPEERGPDEAAPAPDEPPATQPPEETPDEPETGAPPEETEGRRPMVPEDHPLYDRVEGISFANDCRNDGDCYVGGCSSEVCSAEEGIQTTCEARDWPTRGGACGCVDGTCRWYVP